MKEDEENSSAAIAAPIEPTTKLVLQHTPGPWEWDWRYDTDRAEADCGVFTQGRSIGLGHAYAVARCPRYQKKERWEADGRLIAAAPDLLEACQAFIERFDSGQGRCANTDYVAGLMRAAIAKAKVAIGVEEGKERS